MSDRSPQNTFAFNNNCICSCHCIHLQPCPCPLERPQSHDRGYLTGRSATDNNPPAASTPGPQLFLRSNAHGSRPAATPQYVAPVRPDYVWYPRTQCWVATPCIGQTWSPAPMYASPAVYTTPLPTVYSTPIPTVYTTPVYTTPLPTVYTTPVATTVPLPPQWCWSPW